VIEGFGPGGVRVAEAMHQPPVLVFLDRVAAIDVVLPWPVRSLDEASVDNLAPALKGVEILLIGCGARTQLLPKALRQALKEAGLRVEAMDTGAACRTYNTLLQEGRLVAAALLA
jgi:uncharacterized protein